MKVDVWSDVMCPWCAVGRAHLERALTAYDGPVELRWRAFELDPTSPRQVEGDYVAKLGAKYGRSREAAQEMVDQMTERGASVGVPMDFTRVRPGNTFDAHRLLHLAWERGVQDALKERLFQAYLNEGVAVGEPEALVPLAVEVGLDEDEVRHVLSTDQFADAVRGEETLAQQLGIRGVPFFVLDQRVAVSGAQPAEVLVQALQHARDTAEPAPSAEGEVCGPAGCEIPAE